uniref:Putative secreted protein n=1 Tax=Anopheles darlingi TaxID=43151 RepID=A0A2M4DGT0_ANODA
MPKRWRPTETFSSFLSLSLCLRTPFFIITTQTEGAKCQQSVCVCGSIFQIASLVSVHPGVCVYVCR